MKDVVELVTSESPPLRYTVDQIVATGQRRRQRRRLGWAASGATVLVALGVVVTVAVPSLAGGVPSATASRHSTATGPAAPGTDPASTAAAQSLTVPTRPFTFSFGGYRVGKLRVTAPIDVSTSYEIASVYSDDLTTNDKAADPNAPPPTHQDPTLYAYLTLYRPGAYDPTKLVGAKQVTVAGHSGLETSEPGLGGTAIIRTLAWQYTANAWAVISANSTEADKPSAADLRQLAAGLPAAAPTTAKVPLTMGYVPSGYRLDEVAMHAMTGLNGIAAARDGDYAGLLFSNPALPTTGLTEPYGGVDGSDPPGSFLVFVVPSGNSNQQASPGISCMNGFCNRWFENGGVNVQVASGGRLSNSEMTRILNGITLGNVHDTGTWTEVGAAIH